MEPRPLVSLHTRLHWLSVGALLVLSSCVAKPAFKTVVFAGGDVDPTRVFEIGLEQIRRHYSGLVIRADAESGHLETDQIEFNTEKGVRREQVFLDVRSRDDGSVEIGLFIPISKMEFSDREDNPYRWRVYGVDGKVEQQILDEIIGSVLLEFPGADVVPA